MLFVVLGALFCIIIQPVVQHYIGVLDDCTLSKICNHTWVSICGHDVPHNSFRLFLDKCDLHEYNCSYNMSFVEEDSEECGKRCTHNDSSYHLTTPMNPGAEAKQTEIRRH